MRARVCVNICSPQSRGALLSRPNKTPCVCQEATDGEGGEERERREEGQNVCCVTVNTHTDTHAYMRAHTHTHTHTHTHRLNLTG